MSLVPKRPILPLDTDSNDEGIVDIWPTLCSSQLDAGSDNNQNLSGKPIESYRNSFEKVCGSGACRLLISNHSAKYVLYLYNLSSSCN